MKQAADNSTYLSDYRVPNYLIDTTYLEIDLDPTSTQVTNTMQLRQHPDASDQSLFLQGEHLSLQSIYVDEQSLDNSAYEVKDNGLLIHQLPKQCQLQIVSTTCPEQNTALEGLYLSNGRFFTQNEAEGFRRITYYQDRPDVLAKFTTHIIADKATYPVLLSNGDLVDSGDLDNGKHFAKWVDPYPKPCYLFALVAGDFAVNKDTFVTSSGKTVSLEIYVEPDNLNKTDYAITSLKKAMRWDEQAYGREYDLNTYMICAVDDFNMGAMENKGLNIFNSQCVLANNETATDADFETIDAVVGHEYFHNWTGNRITCRDWFQLCLKEGLTVYREQSFMESIALPVSQRIDAVRLLKTWQFSEDAGPMAHPVRPLSYIEINNFYTVTIYEKGAELYRMLNTLLGDEAFRAGMDRYFEHYDGQAATIDQFVENMQEATGKDLSQFALWYSQAGTPVIDVQTEYEPNTQRFTLTLSQSVPSTSGQDHKQPMHIPFAVGLLDEQGNTLATQLEGETSSNNDTRVLELTQAKQSFTFEGISGMPVMSLLRGFSAPVKVNYEYTDEQLRFLFMHDSDDFNRWEAGQQYAMKTLLDCVRNGSAQSSLDEAFVEPYLAIAQDTALHPAFKAQLLSLPSEKLMIEQLDEVDVMAVCEARDTVKRFIAQALSPILLDTYHLQSNASTHEAKYHRELKNSCLDMLMFTQTDEVKLLCREQYEQVQNMTDTLVALRLYADVDDAHRAAMLTDFIDRWSHDTLVVNKWLSTQALSRLPSTLTIVKGIIKSQHFSIKNPNNVRSLIGAFCEHNLRGFHAKDNSGYEFLADHILLLNELNPQVASRLVHPLINWKRFSQTYQVPMQAALQRLLAHKGLSKDVYEVVSKSLADA